MCIEITGANQKAAPVRCSLRIRLEREEVFWGIGISRLLHCVQKTSSLRAAARLMHISYSKAWKILKTAEEGLGFPLLKKETGGRAGGGSELTDAAARLTEAYDAMVAETDRMMQQYFTEHIAPLLSEKTDPDTPETIS